MQSNRISYPSSVWLALAAVYVIWGSTYLGIRFAIESIPPFFMAGSRFLVSGLLLYAFARWKGASRPTGRHWRSATVIGFYLILVGNGGVTWAEQKVPSGVTALLVGTVPLWMAVLEGLGPKGRRPGWKEWTGIALGMTGIGLLVSSRESFGAGPSNLWAWLLLVGTSLAWSYGSLLTRSAAMPSSALLGTAMEMLTGGILQLGVGFILGEQEHFHFSSISTPSIQAWGYLTLVGSLAGFTSYIWVLQKATAGLASTYAFVNPVIAVFLGWFLGGEILTPVLFLAGGLIVTAVVLIVLAQKNGQN